MSETPEETGLKAGRKATKKLRPFTPAEIRQLILLARKINARNVVPPASADDEASAA